MNFKDYVIFVVVRIHKPGVSMILKRKKPLVPRPLIFLLVAIPVIAVLAGILFFRHGISELQGQVTIQAIIGFL